MAGQATVRIVVGLATALVALALAFGLGRWTAPSQAAPPETAFRAATEPRGEPAPAHAVSSLREMENWSESELRTRYIRLAERERLQASELARLRAALTAASAPANAKPAAASAGLAPSGAATPAAPNAKPSHFVNPLEAQFYPPDPADLSELAKHCSVRVDSPPILDSTPEELGNVEEKLRASPDEVRAMKRVATALHTTLRDRLRAIYEEVLGHAPSAELSSRALISEIQDKTPMVNRKGVYGRISKERAGELAPPADVAALSPYERATRMMADLGDEYQSLLANELSPARAHELRSERTGWPWGRSQFTGCE